MILEPPGGNLGLRLKNHGFPEFLEVLSPKPRFSLGFSRVDLNLGSGFPSKSSQNAETVIKNGASQDTQPDSPDSPDSAKMRHGRQFGP